MSIVVGVLRISRVFITVATFIMLVGRTAVVRAAAGGVKLRKLLNIGLGGCISQIEIERLGDGFQDKSRFVLVEDQG